MLDLKQIQSNILRGYVHGHAPKVVHYLFLAFDSAPAARKLLLALSPLITNCDAYDQRLRANPGQVPTSLNLGLAYPTLALLGLGGNARALDERDHEATGAIEAFKCGMKARASAILGDRGPSAPENWEAPYRETLHAVVSLSSGALDSLEDLRERVTGIVAALAEVRIVHEESGQHFEGDLAGKEHFGFVDGISQPSVLNSGEEGYPGDGTPRKHRGWDPLQPGEFVLGQIDESGKIQFGSPLFKHGSFMVFRKLQQHVERFHDYTRAVAKQQGQTPTYVGAKMVGRWPSGAPLVLSPKKDTPKLGANARRNNDFRYASDAKGEACPFGAHIRRNNPREDPSGPLAAQTRLHRIIRRATPYGPWLGAEQADDGKERGTLFVVINADISRQFEFIQQNWVDDVLSSTRLTLPDDRDPLIAQQVPGAKFVIPSSSKSKSPTIAWDLPSFVTTRGGAYFLLPSVDTIFDIAHAVVWPDEGEQCGTAGTQAGTQAGTEAAPERCTNDVSANKTEPSEPPPESTTAPPPDTVDPSVETVE